MTTWKTSGFESVGHYEESMKDFTRVLDYLDRAENISEERKELYHRSLDEIGMDGVFELARNTNELFKELGINSYNLEKDELTQRMGFSSWNAYINLNTERVPEPRSARKVPRTEAFLETIKGDIHNFREESFNHSSNYHPNSPNWDYVTSEMNKKYAYFFRKEQLQQILKSKKTSEIIASLTDEEE